MKKVYNPEVAPKQLGKTEEKWLKFKRPKQTNSKQQSESPSNSQKKSFKRKSMRVATPVKYITPKLHQFEDRIDRSILREYFVSHFSPVLQSIMKKFSITDLSPVMKPEQKKKMINGIDRELKNKMEQMRINS